MHSKLFFPHLMWIENGDGFRSKKPVQFLDPAYWAACLSQRVVSDTSALAANPRWECFPSYCFHWSQSYPCARAQFPSEVPESFIVVAKGMFSCEVGVAAPGGV